MDKTRRERERQMREGEIIDAAAKVFGLKGFDNASMDEIAREAQFTKRTLYQYFENKEDLFLAAVLKGFQNLRSYLEEAVSGAEDGFRKLRNGAQGHYRFYLECGGAIRMIGEFGHVKQRAGEGSRRQKDLLQFNGELFQWIAGIIREGQEDGSVREDVEPLRTAYSIVFMMTGFFNQLSQTGKSFTSRFSLDPREFSEYSMNLLFASLEKRPENKTGASSVRQPKT